MRLKFSHILWLASTALIIWLIKKKKKGAELPLLETVEKVDLDKYAGQWFEIASFPTRFQKGCSCTSATYIPRKNFIEVYNQCFLRHKDKWKNIKGKAYPVKGSGNGKLKVQFFWPFRGDYWIIALDKNYSWVAVSEPRRKYLWILSRTKTMEENTFQDIIERLKEKHFKLDRLQRTSLNCPKV
ncbi:lipocalin family protein [Xanthovirga aplysinae]|uniref:lipocalin family protein n=1 Tax=Xanthovirga aplysinae TaxID=2529853 RepID=UPI0012BC6183|nr:lipocalin family protein [Xanthovirga aplysinae]MTI31528.1 hypothetical protein [Xanthovirga aplysinae]